jgi:hypothetical protein
MVLGLRVRWRVTRNYLGTWDQEHLTKENWRRARRARQREIMGALLEERKRGCSQVK